MPRCDADRSSPSPTGKPVRCNTCTIDLVRLASRRAWWFGPARAPLVLGMRAMAWLHRVDPGAYALRSEECRGCLRFLKLELKERSRVFRVMNDLINPHFDRIRDSLLTPEEIAESRAKASSLYGSGAR